MKLNQSKLLTAIIYVIVLLNSAFYYSATATSNMTISGSISLPIGTVASIDGIDVQVFALRNGNLFNNVDVLIPENSNSVNFSITVPSGSIYKVGYWINTTGSIYVDGYYSKTATLESNVDATQISATNGENSNIKITIFRRDTITGTLSLPYGQVAPAGGVQFDMYGLSQGTVVMDNPDVIIVEGASKVDYTLSTITTSGTANYQIGYWSNSNTNYLDGYYNSNGTVLDSTDATTINVVDGLTGSINIYALLPNTVCSQEPEIANHDNVLIDNLLGNSSAKVTTRVTNTTDKNENVQLWLCLYDSDGKLVDLTQDRVLLAPNDYSLLVDELSLSGITSGHYIKVFLWGMDNYMPFTKNIIFQ